MYIKECKANNCTKTCINDNPRTKYCSQECKEYMAKFKSVEWQKKNPGYHKKPKKSSPYEPTMYERTQTKERTEKDAKLRATQHEPDARNSGYF